MKYIIPILVFSMLLVSGCNLRDCGNDWHCFMESAKSCSRARVSIVYEDNSVRLTTRGVWFGECKVSLKIEKVGQELRQRDPVMADMAEGKTLNCAIPLEIVEYNSEQYIDEILNIEDRFDEYCSGPIKDALQGPLRDIVKKELEN